MMRDFEDYLLGDSCACLLRLDGVSMSKIVFKCDKCVIVGQSKQRPLLASTMDILYYYYI